MADIIKDTVDAMELDALVKTTAAVEVPVVELTKTLVEDVVAKLVDIEANNGYRGISKATGVIVAEVKDIHKAMKARIAELAPANVKVVEAKGAKSK